MIFAIAVEDQKINQFYNYLATRHLVLLMVHQYLKTPLTTLDSGKDYARGILLKISYPTNDSNSEEIGIDSKSVELTIETFDGISTTYPLYNLFIMFTNPKSNDPAKIINKIEITNPNTDYAIRITGLVVFGTSL
jgi:hypothetical protein